MSCLYCGRLIPSNRKFCDGPCNQLLNQKIRTDYERNPKQCKNCGSNISYSKRINVFCGSSCAAEYNNKRRPPRSEESRKKVSDIMKNKISSGVWKEPKRLFGKDHPGWKGGKSREITTKKCPICNIEFTSRNLTFSTVCQNKKASIRQTEYLKNPENRKKYRGNSAPSYMEIAFKEWLLEEMNIPNNRNGFLTELHFFNRENKKHGWIDFIFPKLKLIIELDGTHHRKRKKLDTIRDAYLIKKGYTVIRIEHKDFIRKKHVDSVVKLLEPLTNPLLYPISPFAPSKYELTP